MRRFSIFALIILLSTAYYSLAQGAPVQEIFKQAQKFQKEKKYSQAIANYTKVVQILVKAGNKPVAQQIEMNIGVLHYIQGEYDQALKTYRKALALYAKPQAKLRVKLLRNLASAHYKVGNFASATEIREQVLSDKALDPKIKPVLLSELAAAYRAGEMYCQAVKAYKKAIGSLTKSGNNKALVLLRVSLGQSLAKLGRFEEAISILKEANGLARQLNLPRSVAESHSNLGVIYWDMGHYSAALNQLDTALHLEKQEDLKENLGADLNNRGLVLKSAGRSEQALSSVEEAILIARKLDLSKDEAISLSNRALIRRILGRNEAARQDYQTALKLYEKISFQEGQASCYLGLGKLCEVVDSNYQNAHDYYQKAINIYRKLGNIGYQAEALIQLGRVLKKGIDKGRTTRDLMFEDESPVFIDLLPAKAAELSEQAYSEALSLGRISQRQEVIWSALQGLGFALREQGHLEEALAKYQEAVSVVVNIRFGGADSELMENYLKDKEDLFTEGMEVCATLYADKKDPEYLKLQMEFQEIYKNEVMKGAATASSLSFEDSAKAGLFSKINEIGAKKKKLAQAEGKVNEALEKEKSAKTKSPEQDKRRAKLEKEAAQVKIESHKLDQTFKELLAQWRVCQIFCVRAIPFRFSPKPTWPFVDGLQRV